jgi:uncharacterized protein
MVVERKNLRLYSPTATPPGLEIRSHHEIRGKNRMSPIGFGSKEIQANYQKLLDIIKEMGRVAVAFSGGTDSSLLLKAASDVLGKDVLAITALSETTPRHEKTDAIEFAKEFGITHVCIDTRELSLQEFVQNPPDKCYICKKYRLGELVRAAGEKGFRWVADGENLDDAKDYRPGARAARELGVRSPLREAGLTKAGVRAISRHMNLPTWDKPAYACLASRIPYGSPITAEKLRQVDAGEEYIRSLGLARQARVRHEGETARIEVEEGDMPGFLEPAARRQVITHFRNLGFKFIALDLEGYRMGSLNQTLWENTGE